MWNQVENYPCYVKSIACSLLCTAPLLRKGLSVSDLCLEEHWAWPGQVWVRPQCGGSLPAHVCHGGQCKRGLRLAAGQKTSVVGRPDSFKWCCCLRDGAWKAEKVSVCVRVWESVCLTETGVIENYRAGERPTFILPPVSSETFLFIQWQERRTAFAALQF